VGRPARSARPPGPRTYPRQGRPSALRAAVEGLAVAPYKGGLTAHQGVRSLRVATSGGEFRVLYILHEADRCVLVAMIGPRKDVYDLLKRSELAP
jgi:hypothetical protein